MTRTVLRADDGVPAGVSPIFHISGTDVMGYIFDGAERGPTLLAAGYRAALGPAFDRIARLPSLPWLRGRLILAFADGIDPAEGGLCVDTLFDEPIDEQVFFGFQANHPTSRRARERFEREAFRTILRLCTRLGMISGRGVPGVGSADVSGLDKSARKNPAE